MSTQAKLDRYKRLEQAIKDLRLVLALSEDYGLESKVDALLSLAEALLDAHDLDRQTRAMITSIELELENNA